MTSIEPSECSRYLVINLIAEVIMVKVAAVMMVMMMILTGEWE